MKDKGVKTKDLTGFRHPNEQEANKIPGIIRDSIAKEIKVVKFQTCAILFTIPIIWLILAVLIYTDYSDSQADKHLLVVSVEAIVIVLLLVLYLLCRMRIYKSIVNRVVQGNYRIMDCSLYGGLIGIDGEYYTKIIDTQSQVSNSIFKVGLGVEKRGDEKVILLNCGRWYRVLALQ